MTASIPNNLEEEAALLGCLITEANATREVADLLRPEHFYREFNQKIYEAILSLYKDNIAIDNISVANRYDELGGRKFAGQRAILATFMEAGYTTSHDVRQYAQHLIDLYRRREAIYIHQNSLEDLRDLSKPVGPLLSTATEHLFNLGAGEGEGSGVRSLDAKALPDALRRLQAARNGEEGERVVPYPWAAVTALSPLRPGEVSVVCGRPGMAKSSYILNAALHAARQNIPVGIFSLEMNGSSLALRLISMISGINSQIIEKGKTSDEEHRLVVRAVEELAKLPIHIDDNPNLDEMRFIADSRTAQQKFRLGLIILDYLTLMTRKNKESDHQAVGSCARTVRKTARMLEIPILEVCQVSRNCEYRENKRPLLSDLRECVTGDTQLIDADSGKWIEIKNISPGARILALGSHQKIDVFSVDNVWKTGIKQVFEVQTRTGRKIKTSANHPFLTHNGWKPLEDLEIGNEVATAIWVDSDLLWERIETITPIGLAETYDISVPKANNFIGNGIIVHNSGEIEQEADIVLALYRDDYYNTNNSKMPGVCEVNVLKHRNGPLGTSFLHFHNETTRFFALDFARSRQ